MVGFKHGVEVVENLDGIRTVSGVGLSVAGIIGTAPDADADVFPLNIPVVVSTPTQAKALGVAGTLYYALEGFYDNGGGRAVVVRVEEGVDEAASRTNVVGDSVAQTGVHAFLLSESLVKTTPRIIAAPGFTHFIDADAANPVVAELAGILPKLRAVAVIDGAGTTDVNALAEAAAAGSDRFYLVDPGGLVVRSGEAALVAEKVSGRVAGLMASRPYYESPSNQIIAGIVGTTRPILHFPQDSTGQSNVLNEGNVATIIHRNGFRLWGNRGCGDDARTAFISVRRIFDAVAESIERGHDWAIDKKISSQLVTDIIGGVNAFLRQLRDEGGIINGKAWLNPDLNTPESLAAGRVYIDFDIAASTPLERLTFTLHNETGYFDQLIGEVLSAA